MPEEEVATLIAYCLAGLEQCILRFAEHHKSFYRLSHFFFNNKKAKNTVKCKDLLLGTYTCQFYPGQNFQGLFAERRSTNFFNVSIFIILIITRSNGILYIHYTYIHNYSKLKINLE